MQISELLRVKVHTSEDGGSRAMGLLPFFSAVPTAETANGLTL